MSSNDELDQAHEGSLSASQPTLDRHKRRSLWKSFKKKTNPLRRWHSFRSNKERRPSDDVGGSCLYFSQSEISQDSDSGTENLSLTRGASLSPRNVCHSETDLTTITNGGFKKKNKKKSLSFEDQKLHRKKQVNSEEKEDKTEILEFQHSVSNYYFFLEMKPMIPQKFL